MNLWRSMFFFSLGGSTRPTVSWRAMSSWGLWEPDMRPGCPNGGHVKEFSGMGRRLFALMKNIKTYVYIYDTICTPSQELLHYHRVIFNPRSCWCKPDENMKLARMEASEPSEKEWKSTSIQVHFETNLEPCKGYLKVANHKILSLPCSKLESHGISSISGLGNQKQPDACRGVQTARRFSSVLRHTGYSGTQTTSSFHNVMTKQPNKPTWCEVRWKSKWIRSVSDTSWAVMRKHPIFQERKMLQTCSAPPVKSSTVSAFWAVSRYQIIVSLNNNSHFVWNRPHPSFFYTKKTTSIQKSSMPQSPLSEALGPPPTAGWVAAVRRAMSFRNTLRSRKVRKVFFQILKGM